MLQQIIECFFGGIKLGFQAIISVFPLYNELSGLRTELICKFLGIPAIVFTIGGLCIAAIKLIKKICQ